MQELSELKKRIRLLEYIQQQGGYNIKALGGGKYRITPCPVCGYKGDFTLYDETNSYSSGMNCCQGGSIIDYFMEAEKMTKEDAIRKLRTLAGEDVTEKKEPAAVSQTTTSTEKHLEYYYNRGLTDKTIQKYGLSYDEKGPYGKAYPYKLPVTDEFIIWRAADETADPRYKNSGSVQLFNEALLKDPKVKAIGITEGIFDALALEEAGLPSVALNSTANKARLNELLDGLEADQTIIIAMDNDEAGKSAAEEVEEACRSRNIICRILRSEHKDPNEHLLKDREGLRWAVESIHTAGTVGEYIRHSFIDDLQKHYQQKEIKTGIKKLDAVLGGGLYPGLYVLGAVTGLGKTAYSLQIADNIAAAGHKVLFFSLEMGLFEMICRSIAREIKQMDPETKITTGHILRGKVDDKKDIINDHSFNLALEYYGGNIADNIDIEEGNFDLNMSRIREQVRRFQDSRPVVFIDYLQIIRSEDPRATDKQNTDFNVTELKRLSRDMDIPIIAISSFNRTGYKDGGFEAFKESGGIEYSADVVLAMMIEGDGEMDKMKNWKENPRPVSLEILKNRRGKIREDVRLDYYPANNYFEERRF